MKIYSINNCFFVLYHIVIIKVKQYVKSITGKAW